MFMYIEKNLKWYLCIYKQWLPSGKEFVELGEEVERTFYFILF